MKRQLLCMLLLAIVAGRVQGQALIYRPVNPSFGGNTFNYAWMLSSATAQDKTKDPASIRTSTTTNSSQSTLNSFAESLQRQLLSRITSDVISKQFGESSLKPGTYSFGDYQVEITNGVDGIQIRIVDTKGGETTVTVPYF